MSMMADMMKSMPMAGMTGMEMPMMQECIEACSAAVDGRHDVRRRGRRRGHGAMCVDVHEHRRRRHDDDADDDAPGRLRHGRHDAR